MYIENSIIMQGNWEDIWRFSSQIEHWPEWLPHYRQVNINSTHEGPEGEKKNAFMSAWRDFLPVSWTTIQTLIYHSDPAQARVLYRHIGGVTRGMEVIWSFQPLENKFYRVSISHDWTAPWPLVGKPATYFIQAQIVHNIAAKTLTTIRDMALKALQADPGPQFISRAAL